MIRFSRFLDMKKAEELGAGGYVNDALTCSSLDITNPKDLIPHGSQSGSDEFICKLMWVCHMDCRDTNRLSIRFVPQ